MMEKRVSFRLETNIDSVDPEQISDNTSWPYGYEKPTQEELKKEYINEIRKIVRNIDCNEDVNYVTVSHEFIDDKTSVLKLHFSGEEEDVNGGIEKFKKELNQYNFEETKFGIEEVDVERDFFGMVEAYQKNSDVIVSTTESIPGHEIGKVIDIVSGNVVVPYRAEVDLVSSKKVEKNVKIFKNTRVMNDLRKQAMNRMTKAAKNLDADAIIGVDFKTSRLPGSSSGGTSSGSTVEMEILAYGTAVKLK